MIPAALPLDADCTGGIEIPRVDRLLAEKVRGGLPTGRREPASPVGMAKPRLLTHGDLRRLAGIVCEEFDVSFRRLRSKGGHRQVMAAKRFLCFYAHEAHGMPHVALSRFLRLSHDGSRMLARGLHGRMIDEHAEIWGRVTTAFLGYLAQAATKRGEQANER
jgi:hypothetical protein